jgi:2-dehydro-3-deoxyglucarate aldolase
VTKYRLEMIQSIRIKMQNGKASVGTWIQIPNPSLAEILGHAGYDWIAVDLEHGSISIHQLPDIFRAIELGGTLPIVRLAQGNVKDCKQALDAGAGGVIVPMVETAEHLNLVRDSCCWPPYGTRGVGYSRANLFGKHFNMYAEEAKSPLIIAQIESIKAVENLDAILNVKGLDALFLGPYDLSASMGIVGQFENADFKKAISKVLRSCDLHTVPAGIHIINPIPEELKIRIDEGYKLIAYSMDSVFLCQSSEIPKIK